jgi:L-ascorbate metabolism protein UlaG (beta-lactamase superfamily)
LAILPILIITLIIFFNTTPFGRHPSGERLKRIELSSNYKNGKFQNQISTTVINKNKGFFSGVIGMVSAADKKSVPDIEIPTQKTDFMNLPKDENLIIWMGHSSLYIQLNGKKILVDPVFSSYASPVSFINRAFKGTNIYSVDIMPEIDILIITHDHWDHLDYPTIKALRSKVKKVICPLGVGAHFERWKYDATKIIENDWNESIQIDDLTIHTLPARHFSGRGPRRGKVLWASYLLQTNDYKIYLSGDTGYGPHFSEIGKRFGNIDIAIMENGQYNAKGWPSIHLLPEQVVKASKELNAKNIIPIHAVKFKLSIHAWNEPHEKLYELIQKTNIQLWTPMIGQKMDLDGTNTFSQWWK